MRRTLKLFVIPSGKPAGSPPEPRPDVEIEAASEDASDDAELELARKDHAWFVAALRDFAKVWVNMSPDNQGRFLRALIDKVVVDEAKGTCRVELIDFGAASGTRDAA